MKITLKEAVETLKNAGYLVDEYNKELTRLNGRF